MAAPTDVRYSLIVDTLVNADRETIWDLLVDLRKVGELYWGSTVESDFVVGHPIVWRGMWEGKPFEDRGIIKDLRRGKLLQYSHWSGGDPPPEKDRNLITVRLEKAPGGTRVSLQHDNIASLAMKEHSETMWRQLLSRLKETAERG